MKGVVARVSDDFQGRTTDPFDVFFAKGIHAQASRDLYANPANYPLVWLVMNFPEVRGKDFSIYGEITCTLLLLMPTDSKYTQQEREDMVFTPRLLPLYQLLMQEIARERWFQFKGSNSIEHTRQVRPYWGGGDVNGADTPNLFKKQVDAISITNLKIRVKLGNCSGPDYAILPS